MITQLNGTIVSLDHQQITLLTTSGIGFAVSVADERLFIVDQAIKLYIYFHWHTENGPQLFGFTDQHSREVFTLIISCSGIGPKMGLLILANMGPNQFLQAITLADSKVLSSISGIGAKKAEVMIMHLKDKISKMQKIEGTDESAIVLNKLKELTQALSSLNYSKQETSFALEFLKKNYSIEKSSFDELLRKSLSFLAKKA